MSIGEGESRLATEKPVTTSTPRENGKGINVELSKEEKKKF